MARHTHPSAPREHDPLWYKKAIIYQAHVRSFCDSDADGIGDFRGLTGKLGYLQDLGVTAVWILPFYPSPLRDDGYDIADYCDVNPIYGTLADFRAFLKEAHRRGLRVITELVINHTSDRHGWFQKSRRAPRGSRWRDFYVWSETEEKYREARIIFRDFEPSNWTWDPVAGAFYWHRFYSHQPDLNFDNPEVHREIFKVLDFWLEMGVDGLRLDAVPYLYEREGTDCENLPETHAFLKKLREHVDAKYGDRMLLAGANQWPEDSAAYFGKGAGDECHMAFHFPLMPRLFMAIRMEDRVPIIDILEQTPAIPATSQWALFLRNHDELTLEMVTDEERDYMYRVYAQDTRARINPGIRRRLAPLLGNDRRRIELLCALLLSMPGTPVIYYGDEIGMGDNVFLGDRNGVRTPMQWSSDKNAGFSRANPHSLYLPINLDPEYHYEAVNVEVQQRNQHSLLWWMKRMLGLRRRWRAFGLGTIEFLQPENRKILAYVRSYEAECILVVCNLSRFVQAVELDLSKFAGRVPVELFGRNAFPAVSARPYFLTLGPHSFYWFSLAPEAAAVTAGPSAEVPSFTVRERWDEVLGEALRPGLDGCLQAYIRPRRWFGGKSREIKSVGIRAAVPVPSNGGRAHVLLLDVDYVQGEPECYQLPVAFATGAEAGKAGFFSLHLVIARVHVEAGGVEGVLYDASASGAFARSLFDCVSRRRAFKGMWGEIEGFAMPALKRLRGEGALEPRINVAEQSNSAILFGDRFILKSFRRVETGANPDLEIGRFLAEREFPYTPALAGGIEYKAGDGSVVSLGILSELVPNCTDGWKYTLDALGRYYDRVGSLPEEQAVAPETVSALIEDAARAIPRLIEERMGTYIETARLLGDRTAALHLCLGSEAEDPAFAPEPFNPFYQRSLFQSLRNQTAEAVSLLRKSLGTLPEEVRETARRVLEIEKDILEHLRAVRDVRIAARRLRVHGDYHLGQVLHTGKDFLIIDFEGEPARPISERRIKHTPLRDVAGMLRSFDYASHAVLYDQLDQGVINAERMAQLEPWARFWTHWASVVFLSAYLARARQGGFLPDDTRQLEVLIETNLLSKAAYELCYELNNRPGWLRVPLNGILRLMER